MCADTNTNGVQMCWVGSAHVGDLCVMQVFNTVNYLRSHFNMPQNVL